MPGIPIEEINPQVLLEKGIVSAKIDSKVIALSKVLDAIRSCSYSDSVWALEQSLTLIKSEEVTPEEVAPVDYGHKVIEIVAQTFGFSAVHLESRSRSAEMASARQVAMYLLWMSEKYTLDYIGQLLGGRSPATVSHGAQAVIRRINTDTRLGHIVEKLRAGLD